MLFREVPSAQIGTNGLIPAPEKTARHYQFFEGKQLDVSIQVPLQQIQDIDYRQPPDNNFVLSYMIRLHGKVLIDTTQRIDVPDPMIFSQFRLINHNTAQVDITLPSPGRSAEGLYEYQFYLSSLGVQALLTITECDESYKNFLTGGIRLPFYLVGETTIFITMASKWRQTYSLKMGGASLKKKIKMLAYPLDSRHPCFSVHCSRSKRVYYATTNKRHSSWELKCLLLRKLTVVAIFSPL